MAKFLNTSATNYHLEELIKSAKERLILISPFLKLSDRIRELLQDKNNLKIDTRIIYGKNEMQKSETEWFSKLSYIRASFCKNLHAKCYLNEDTCIITSLNLYEFSQVNNNEIGVLISRNDDAQIYQEALDEAQRLIRISTDTSPAPHTAPLPTDTKPEPEQQSGKLTTSKLAQKLNLKTEALFEKLIRAGYLEDKGDKKMITPEAKKAGGEFRMSPRYGPYFIWPDSLTLKQLAIAQIQRGPGNTQ